MDEVILKVTSEELSEFPCSLEPEYECDKDKVGIKESKGSNVKLERTEKGRRRRREKKGGKKRKLNIAGTHHLPTIPPLVVNSITRFILLDLASCQCDSLDKAYSLHLVTPGGMTE